LRQLLERNRKSARPPRARTGVAALILAGVLLAAPAALANTTKSINWAGYAVHRAGMSFRGVSASWIQPSATCVSGRQTYSAVWVGLGGYKPSSDALEQIGTEVDCNPAGRVVSSAWYELVPAPSRTIGLAVQPGDQMQAAVTVVGNRVVVELDNLTEHRQYRKVAYSPSIDVSSAEWIVEAPSECVSQVACQALPLANFGSVTFTSASATPTSGRSGGIVDRRWGSTRIRLTPGGQRFVVQRNVPDTVGSAAPSAPRVGGSAFDVTYATAAAPQTQSFARDARPRAAYIRH
jgi:Peptidase A4 family